MKACFADNASLPVTCVFDEPGCVPEIDCTFAKSGNRDTCPMWPPNRSLQLCVEILGGIGFCEFCPNAPVVEDDENDGMD